MHKNLIFYGSLETLNISYLVIGLYVYGEIIICPIILVCPDITY